MATRRDTRGGRTWRGGRSRFGGLIALSATLALGAECAAETPGGWKNFSVRPVVEEGGTELSVKAGVPTQTPTVRVGEPLLDGSCVQSSSVKTETIIWPADRGKKAPPPFEDVYIEAKLSPECADRLAKYAAKNRGRQLALVVGTEVWTLPMIRGRTTDAISIPHFASEEEAERGAATLRGESSPPTGGPPAAERGTRG